MSIFTISLTTPTVPKPFRRPSRIHIAPLMSLLANILGFSFFGLTARVGQLAIQKRNLLENPGGHALAMGVFGYAGYWAYHWDKRAAVLIAEKRQKIIEHRAKIIANADAAAASALEE